MGSDAAKVCGALFCFAVTIASIVMFGCSFDTINPQCVRARRA